MWVFYALALIPIAVGAWLWVKFRQITWWEWACLGSSLALAALFHLAVIKGMTNDTETWSGQAVSTTFHPYWEADWWETETYTDGKGKTHTRMVHRHVNHSEYWDCAVSYGSGVSETIKVSKAFSERVKAEFGSIIDKEKPGKPHFSSGDPYVYVARNHTGAIVPACVNMKFENRVAAAPSLFSYEKVPDDVPVFDYPRNADTWTSDRVLGTARGAVSRLEWDKMNARVGPRKKANVILVGFGDGPPSLAQSQEAKWVGGKKNDVVICYGGPNDKPAWSYCFGWTDSEIVKKNLQSIVLHGPVDDAIVAKIESEIVSNYQIKEWRDFDYISIEPPLWSYALFFLVLIASTAGITYWAFVNDETKDGHIARWQHLTSWPRRLR